VRLQAGLDITAPPADVFRFVATEHFRNHPTWDPAVLEMTQTSPGPMSQGTTARLVRSDGGRRTEGVVTVTRFEPDRAFAAVVEFGPFRLDQQAICSPATDGRTRLTLVINTRAKGLPRLLLPVMRPRFAATMRTSLESIRQHLEASPPQ
jgi:hypothetical protein